MNIPRGSLLAVEDIPNLSELFEATPCFEGNQVSAAHNGQEAFDRIAQKRSALISTDIPSPKMDSCALADPLRSDPKRRPIPILILSANYVTLEQVKTQSPCGRP
jgi:CheY-like chemotaxis protein